MVACSEQPICEFVPQVGIFHTGFRGEEEKN